MIKRALHPESVRPYHIVPIPDTHVHSVWVGHVVSLVPKFDLVYTNSPLVVRLFREKGFAGGELPLVTRERRAKLSIHATRKRSSHQRDADACPPRSRGLRAESGRRRPGPQARAR